MGTSEDNMDEKGIFVNEWLLEKGYHPEKIEKAGIWVKEVSQKGEEYLETMLNEGIHEINLKLDCKEKEEVLQVTNKLLNQKKFPRNEFNNDDFHFINYLRQQWDIPDSHS
jgi:hypothetical protein